ncbi:hypothetical protein LG314_11930 [Agrococcus terreus]|uniref:hypothetical protein n=1 Tax=Agrococcus terreus TaxID=574649 RepID=UPI00384C85AB
MSALINAIKWYLRNYPDSVISRAIRYAWNNKTKCLWWVARYGLSGAVSRILAAVR